MNQLNKERLFKLDFTNEDQLRLIEEFEKNNNESNRIRDYKPTEDENKLEEVLFLEEDDIVKDVCLIEGERDIKIGKIYFSPLKNQLKNRSLINISINYCLNTLGLETVVIPASKDDNYLFGLLQDRGYEYLGIEGEEHLFLKDKESKQEERIDEQRAIKWKYLRI